MSWFVRFLAGGVTACMGIGVALSALSIADQKGGFAAMRAQLADMVKYEGAQPAPAPVPNAVVRPHGGTAQAQGESLSDVFAQLTAFMDPEKREQALGSMNSIKVRPGETPEQAIQRELERWAPLVAAIEGSGVGAGVRGMMMAPVAEKACDPARLSGLSARDRALAEAECNAMKGVMSGKFPFGGDMANLDRNELDLMAAMNGMTLQELELSCRTPAPGGLGTWKQQMRDTLCQQVLADRNRTPAPVDPGNAEPNTQGTAVARTKAVPKPVARAAGQAGYTLDVSKLDLPRQFKAMDPQKLISKCAQPLTDDMSAMQKMFIRETCSRVRAAMVPVK